MVEDELPDAVVLALARTLTLSTATRSGQKLLDVRSRVSVGGMLMEQAATVLSPRAKSGPERLVLDMVNLTPAAITAV